MTRKKLADGLESVIDTHTVSVKVALMAAAELRKTCATCRHFNDGKGQRVGTNWRVYAGCEAGMPGVFMSDAERLSGVVGPVKLLVPRDGTGYCWQHVPHETIEDQPKG